MIMSMIWSGALPHEKNKEGKTFLETSPIRNMLCTKISDSSDDWILKQWKNETLRQSWILLGDDEVLQSFWKRLEILSSFESICSNDILSSIGDVWPIRSKIHLFFRSYLGMISKCYDYDFDKIKLECEKHLNPESVILFCEKVHESLNDFQIQDIMDNLMKGELALGKSFFQNSPIRNKLCTRILESSDEWALKFWKSNQFLEIWIPYEGSDEVLKSVFKRMVSLNQKIDDPFCIANRYV